MRVRHATRTALGILVLAGLAWWSGCSSAVPAPHMPEPAPPALAVDGDALPVLHYEETRLEIPDHLAIGYRYEGLDYSRTAEHRWGEHFRYGRSALDDDVRAVLSEAGYRLGNDGPETIRFVGRMVRVSYNSYVHKSSFNQAECEMVWELYRTGDVRPYFSHKTTGMGREAGEEQGAILVAFDVALHVLLADPEFVAAVRTE